MKKKGKDILSHPIRPNQCSFLRSSKAAMNMFLKCLAQEEPSIVSMCVRPGIVDTDILDNVYSDHSAAVMARDQFQFMKLQKDKGKLLRPEQPAEVMAKLALEGGKGLSGQFFAWDDSRLNAH
jgi:NAD(P)-dependent dehydrogenase (short-subunit alcohol dehydrogenase family)